MFQANGHKCSDPHQAQNALNAWGEFNPSVSHVSIVLSLRWSFTTKLQPCPSSTNSCGL